VVHVGSAITEPPDADVLVWAVGAPWPDLDGASPWLARGDDPPSPVTVAGSSKAAVSVALRARHAGADVTLVPDDPVLAPELGLPGRFRLVTDARAIGVAIATKPPAATAATVRVRRGPATAAPDHREVHVIGDASGTAGIAAALRAAADLARRL